eukprot:1699112-Rhodomonas_salina.1
MLQLEASSVCPPGTSVGISLMFVGRIGGRTKGGGRGAPTPRILPTTFNPYPQIPGPMSSTMLVLSNGASVAFKH